jgi:hypothetical protein
MKTTYYIAHNGKDIFHWGFYEEGESFQTGQPIVETFDDKEKWIERMKFLKIDFVIL